MQEVIKGYCYTVSNVGNSREQSLNFVVERNTSKEKTIITDGTKEDQVLEVLISRVTYLKEKDDCKEYEDILKSLNKALKTLKFKNGSIDLTK